MTERVAERSEVRGYDRIRELEARNASRETALAETRKAVLAAYYAGWDSERKKFAQVAVDRIDAALAGVSDGPTEREWACVCPMTRPDYRLRVEPGVHHAPQCAKFRPSDGPTEPPPGESFGTAPVGASVVKHDASTEGVPGE